MVCVCVFYANIVLALDLVACRHCDASRVTMCGVCAQQWRSPVLDRASSARQKALRNGEIWKFTVNTHTLDAHRRARTYIFSHIGIHRGTFLLHRCTPLLDDTFVATMCRTTRLPATLAMMMCIRNNRTYEYA